MLSCRSKLPCDVALLLFALMVGASAAGAAAQCATQWLPGQGIRGTNAVVHATTVWDPDGPGPMHPVLAVGGEFTIAGGVVANGIAIHDPVSGTWSALGSGMSFAPYQGVFALTTLPNGDLVAGGLFAAAGGVSANNIARWNGTSWSPLGSGIVASFAGGVRALQTLPNGDLAAGGVFTAAGGVIASNIARWNGTSWSPLGSGMNGSGVFSLTTLPNGDLVAGGAFTTAGGVSASGIARWDGTSWSSLGSGMGGAPGTYFAVDSFTTLPNGDFVAGGTFTTAGGMSASNIARWDGTNWSPLGSGVSSFGSVLALTTLANGDVVAGGYFTTAGGVSARYIARWDGTNWSALGSGMGGMVSAAGLSVRALATLPNGDLVAGGGFGTAGGVSAWHIARWDGTNWSASGSGISSVVFALTTLTNGDLVAGGYFTTAGGSNTNGIARWDGTSWSALGSGMSSSPSSIPVRALTTLPNGDLVAGGDFTAAGGVNANHIARWDGSNWSALGSGMGGQFASVFALTTLPNGDLVAAGQFTTAGGVSANNIARWNGTSWSAVGSGVDSLVRALTTLPNGDLIAGGAFATAGGISANSIARWDGTNWSALGPGISPVGGVYALTTRPNGDLVAAGYFTNAGGVSVTNIARWNGANWSALGPGFPLSCDALVTLPNGDLGAGGPFDIQRWDGSNWSVLGSVFDSFGRVYALTTLANGDLVAGGDFTIMSGVVSGYIAQLTTTCPAAVISSGTGCTGSGGPNVLTASTLPWTGSTFRCVATGMPANALAIGVVGFTTTSIPLSSILPQGVAGCSLLVSPDLLDLHVPSSGSAQTQILIPNTTTLAGAVFYQQVLPVEFGAGGAIAALTSTNRLVMVIGSF